MSDLQRAGVIGVLLAFVLFILTGETLLAIWIVLNIVGLTLIHIYNELEKWDHTDRDRVEGEN